MRLSELQPGQTAIIVKVLGHGAFRRRIMEMGFVHGKRVSAILNAPLQDPVKYNVMDYEVSLRRSEASMIEVVTEEQAAEIHQTHLPYISPTVKESLVEQAARTYKRTINVALVGNPNSGKTSLFNAASGSHQHVGNYGGVTVDAKRGSFTHKGYKFVMYDLPGTYALSAYSPEEVYVRQHLTQQTPDVVINVVAASNLERNLYLTTELIDMDCTMVMALNMYDELENSGAQFDHDALGRMLGLPIIPTISRSGRGISAMLDTVIDVYENRDPFTRHIHIGYGQEIEAGIEAMEKVMKAEGSISEQFSTRYLALKMLERDREIEKFLSVNSKYPLWEKTRNEQARLIEKDLGQDIETAISNDKYGFISGALKETFTAGVKEEVQSTAIIDSFVTHKLWGFPVFLFIMWLMFEATFTLGAYPMEWIEAAVEALAGFVSNAMPDGMLKDLIADGIIGGVGGVIVFLPNILILYLFISFMEDSGYMARAAFIMDRLMHKMGLHGKSFIPLIMGFGCNVPAIMATRTIESQSSRLITILINPFISCSARLPVYVLLIGAFFPDHGSLVMLCLYLSGIVIAILTAKMLRRFWFKKDETPFVMELPPYRMPTARATMRHMWDKAAQYLRKMGGIILVASILIWFLSYFPRTEFDGGEIALTQEPTVQIDNIPDNYAGTVTEILKTNLSMPDDTSESQETAPGMGSSHSATIEEYMQQSNSYIGRLGRFISPVMEPLGFNWKISVSLISGAAAKEIVVSTLGVLYPVDEGQIAAPLQERLKQPDPITGKPDFTPLVALSFLVFALLYFPCIAAIVAISRETGSWKWAAFSFFYNTMVAWIAAFLVYNIGSLFVS